MCSVAGHWVFLHEERACCRDNCTRPAYLGGLCGLHFAGAEARDRATALWFHNIECSEAAAMTMENS